MEGHYTYTAFAKAEVDPQRRNALRGLAAAEKHHADLWAGRIQELGDPHPSIPANCRVKPARWQIEWAG